MSKKRRLGDGPDKETKSQIREGAGLGVSDSGESDIKYQISDIRASRKEKILKAIEEGTTKNYYLDKDGQLMTRMLIHLPWDIAEDLRDGVADTFPKKSISQHILERLEG